MMGGGLEEAKLRMTMKSLLQLIIYILSVLALLISIFAALVGWSMWDMPTTITTGGFSGAMAMELGRDHTSPFLFSVASVLGIFAIMLFISAKIFLRTKPSISDQGSKNGRIQ